MTVYLDVLLITNAVVCLVLIEASATVSHRVLKPWRSFCGAAVGALSSLLIAADSDNRYCAAAILILKLSAIVLVTDAQDRWEAERRGFRFAWSRRWDTTLLLLEF